jgi:hypothetical protein
MAPWQDWMSAAIWVAALWLLGHANVGRLEHACASASSRMSPCKLEMPDPSGDGQVCPSMTNLSEPSARPDTLPSEGSTGDSASAACASVCDGTFGSELPPAPHPQSAPAITTKDERGRILQAYHQAAEEVTSGTRASLGPRPHRGHRLAAQSAEGTEFIGRRC